MPLETRSPDFEKIDSSRAQAERFAKEDTHRAKLSHLCAAYKNAAGIVEYDCI
jgi:hypothetical protein